MTSPSVYIASHKIDLPEDEQKRILSNHGIVDANNIANRASSVSTVIKAAGTRNNRRVFGSLHLGTTQQQLANDVPARVELGGMVTLQGQFRYVKTVQKGESLEYHFMIIGQNSWSQLIGNRNLPELDLSDYDHYLSAEVILWSQANSDKSVFLYTHPQPPESGEVEPRHFHLALNLRRMVHLIFNAAGYRLISDFIDSDYFSRIWYHPEFQEKDSSFWKRKEATAGNSVAINHTTGGADPDYNEVPLNLDYDDPEFIDGSGELVNTGLEDPNGHYDTSGEFYQVSKAGGYQVTLRLPFSSASVIADQNFGQLFVDDFLNQQIIKTRTEVNDNDKLFEVTFAPVYLRAGQQLSVKFFYEHPNAASFPRTYEIDQFEANMQVEAITTLSNYELVKLADYYLPDQAQIAIVKDASKLFNLHFATDEATKTVYAEPEGNFYGSSVEAIGQKIDYSRKVTVRKFAEDQKKWFRFRYNGAERGRDVFNAEGKDGEEQIQLEFFTLSELENSTGQYAGMPVLSGEPRNNLFYYEGSKQVEKHQLYRVNNDQAVQPGPFQIPKVEYVPEITFSNANQNLNFEDGLQPGLVAKFYNALINKLELQKIISTHVAWNLLDISRIENEGGNKEVGFRRKYFTHEHGRLRLMEIKNFDNAKQAPAESTFVQDVYTAPFSVTPTTHGALSDLTVQTIIAKVYVERVDEFADPVDIGYTLEIQQVGTVAEYATLTLPYFDDINYSTVLTNPGGFATLTKSLGSGPKADIPIRNNGGVEGFLIPASLNDQSKAPMHFYADSYAEPVWICGYGYDQAFVEFQNGTLYATARSISSGNFGPANCYFTLEIPGQVNTQGQTFVMNVNEEDTTEFTFSLLEPGVYSYTLRLYSDNSGSYQLADSLTANLLVNG